MCFVYLYYLYNSVLDDAFEESMNISSSSLGAPLNLSTSSEESVDHGGFTLPRLVNVIIVTEKCSSFIFIEYNPDSILYSSLPGTYLSRDQKRTIHIAKG